MDWAEYKKLCDKPYVFSSHALSETHLRLSEKLGLGLDYFISAVPIPKPLDHKGDERTDMFEVHIPFDMQDEIVFQLSQYDEKHTDKYGLDRPSPLTKAWQELLDSPY